MAAPRHGLISEEAILAVAFLGVFFIVWMVQGVAAAVSFGEGPVRRSVAAGVALVVPGAVLGVANALYANHIPLTVNWSLVPSIVMVGLVLAQVGLATAPGIHGWSRWGPVVGLQGLPQLVERRWVSGLLQLVAGWATLGVIFWAVVQDLEAERSPRLFDVPLGEASKFWHSWIVATFFGLYLAIWLWSLAAPRGPANRDSRGVTARDST